MSRGGACVPEGGKVMPVSSRVYSVFGHFQNLNLLALLQDLREGRTARQAWLAGSLLCPVAHGLPHGRRSAPGSATVGASIALVPLWYGIHMILSP